MEFDSFFSLPRWKILEILVKSPSSPLELSKELRTSVSYVSQQLKLLEAAGLVKKERTGAAEKGKARTLFSLSQEMLYFTSLTKNVPFKKLLYLTDYHKLILRIWFIEDPRLHYFVERIYWKLEDNLSDIESISLDTSGAKPRLVIVSDSSKVKDKVASLAEGTRGHLDLVFTSRAKQTMNKGFYVLYPAFVATERKGAPLP